MRKLATIRVCIACSIALVLGLLNPLTALAHPWLTYTTPWGTHNPGSGTEYQSYVAVYYDDDTQQSVYVYKVEHHFSNSGQYDLTGRAHYAYNGDGSNLWGPTGSEAYIIPPVEPDEYRVLSFSYNRTGSKPTAGFVKFSSWATHYFPGPMDDGWFVYFWSDLSKSYTFYE